MQPAGVVPSDPSWWRLGEAAILRLARSSGWRPGVAFGGEPSFGRGWDGRTDVMFGAGKMGAGFLVSIVETLSRLISRQCLHVAKLPDHSSVRLCPYGSPIYPMLVIDVDFGEFLLPVGVTHDFIAGHPGISAARIAREMMKTVSNFDRTHARVAVDERKLRDMFVEESGLASTSPLWLRMSPRHVGQSEFSQNRDLHEFAVMLLDQELRPIMSGMRLTTNASYISYYLNFHARSQRLRAMMRQKLIEAGSNGFVTEVALGLIDARGMDPCGVLDTLRAAVLDLDYGGIVHITATTQETLTLCDGVVDAMITFKGGYYSSGKLTLEGEYPESLAISAKGRQLSAFVDHPAFRAAGITISHGRKLRGKLRLYHRVRSVPMEQDARERFGVARS